MDLNKKIAELIEEENNLSDYLVLIGFDKKELSTMGKFISLKSALKAKNIAEEVFIKAFDEYRESIKNEEELKKFGKLKVAGVLPCPIRIPLVDELNKNNLKNFSFNLKSANLGLDHVKESFEKDENPDLIISAGYEMITNENYRKILKRDYISPQAEINKGFIERGADLKDGENTFHIIGIVPAVFIVNKRVLGNKKIPESWEELLSGDYKNSLAIPMSDLDLYNALVISIYERYGSDGLKKLKDAIYTSAHPAQMVKEKELAAISVAPYFFAAMVQSQDLQMVWPKDGAIVSPIFMTAKKDKIEQLKEIIGIFLSEKVAKIFSANGKFPSTNPNTDLGISSDQKLMFPGWDFLNKNIDKKIEKIEEIFKL